MAATVDIRRERLRRLLMRWAKEPYLFVTEVLRAKPTTQQARVLRAVKEGRHIAIRSGHGTGKTATLAWLILWFFCTRYDARIPCTAGTASQLRDVLWPEIAKWIRRLPIELQNSMEWTTERLTGKGKLGEPVRTWFAVARTSRKEKPEALQGFHGAHLLFVIDEASGVPDEIFEVAEGAMTQPSVISIMTGNPTRLFGQFYRAFHKERSLWTTFHFSSEDSELVSDGYAERVERKYGKDSDVYRVRVTGDFPLAESDTFIPLALVEEARRREQPMSAPIVWALDPARFGDNESSLCKRAGLKVYEIDAVRKRDATYVEGWLIDHYNRAEHKPEYIVIETNGLGGPIYDHLYEKGLPVVPCDVSQWAKNEVDVTKRDAIARVRDLLWQRCKDALENGLDLPDDEDLTGQLSSPKYTFDSSGRIVIESKEHMQAERNVDSPDRADSLCLTYFKPKLLFPGLTRRAA